MKPDSATQDNQSVPPPSRFYRLEQKVMAPLLKFTGLSCRQFSELASARLDRPLTRFESMRLRMHGMMCGVCRPLPNQLENLQKLTRACENCDDEQEAVESSGQSLSAEAKQRMRAMFEEK